MSKILRWLHLSDIHFHPKTEWRYSYIRNNLISFLDNMFEENKLINPDIVFCTGDIAFGETNDARLSDQYCQASQFFDDLLSVCGVQGIPLSKNRLYIVPGNHDVNRIQVNKFAQETWKVYAKKSNEYGPAINQSVNDKSKEYKDAVERLNDYRAFVKDYLPHQYNDEAHDFYAKKIDINGLKIGIAGFNSAWTCGGDEDDRTIWLGAELQFNYAINLLNDCDINIGLIHHPIDWLNVYERNIATRRISTEYDFWLHGHSHNAWVEPLQSHVIISAGAVCSDQCNEVGINLVELSFEDEKGYVKLFKSKVAESDWVIEPVAGHAPRGVWEIKLPKKFKKKVEKDRQKGAFSEEEFIVDDSAKVNLCSDEHFDSMVKNYSEHHPKDIQRQIILDVINYSWDKIVYSPYFSDKLINELLVKDNKMTAILLPLCNISLGRQINEQELSAFFDILDGEINDYNDADNWSLILLEIKMIKYLLYKPGEIQRFNCIAKKLEEWSKLDDYKFKVYFVDFELRCLCGYNEVPDNIFKIVRKVSAEFLDKNKDTVLSRLYQMIVDPLMAIKERGYFVLYEEMLKYASYSMDLIECKWCMNAWFRITTIDDIREDEVDYGEKIRMLINSFPSDLMKKSNDILTVYLKSYLRSFVFKKDIKLLRHFEKLFHAICDKINYKQKMHLQIEYVASLYLYVENKDEAEIYDLTPVQIAKADKKKVITNKLFDNAYVEDCFEVMNGFNVDNNVRYNLKKWLNAYLKKVMIFFVRPLVEDNPLTILRFHVLKKLYNGRPILSNAIVRAMRIALNNRNNYPFSFFAYSNAIFNYIGRSDNLDLLYSYIGMALKSEKYFLTKTSYDIAKGIYYLAWYSEVEKNIWSDYLLRFSEITGVGEGEPKVYWLYCVVADIYSNINELEYISELSRFFVRISAKYRQLALRYDESFELHFPEELIKYSERYSGQSIVLTVLNNELNNPEVWNILGTTMFNMSNKTDEVYLKSSSMFYSAAKCFARMRDMNDQKYCYNYIRCNSLLQKAEGVMPGEYFISDTIYYLKRRKSARFTHKKECLIPFVDLLLKYWDKYDLSIKNNVKELFQKKRWLRKEFNKELSKIISE